MGDNTKKLAFWDWQNAYVTFLCKKSLLKVFGPVQFLDPDKEAAKLLKKKSWKVSLEGLCNVGKPGKKVIALGLDREMGLRMKFGTLR